MTKTKKTRTMALALGLTLSASLAISGCQTSSIDLLETTESITETRVIEEASIPQEGVVLKRGADGKSSVLYGNILMDEFGSLFLEDRLTGERVSIEKEDILPDSQEYVEALIEKTDGTTLVVEGPTVKNTDGTTSVIDVTTGEEHILEELSEETTRTTTTTSPLDRDDRPALQTTTTTTAPSPTVRETTRETTAAPTTKATTTARPTTQSTTTRTTTTTTTAPSPTVRETTRETTAAPTTKATTTAAPTTKATTTAAPTTQATTTTAPTTKATTTTAPTEAPKLTDAQMAREILKYLNQYRVEQGLPAFKTGETKMWEAAQIRAHEIVTNFEHWRIGKGTDGMDASWNTVMWEVGISDNYTVMAECLSNTAPWDDAKFIAYYWDGSPAHKTVILRAQYTTAAIGYVDRGEVEGKFTVLIMTDDKK